MFLSITLKSWNERGYFFASQVPSEKAKMHWRELVIKKANPFSFPSHYKFSIHHSRKTLSPRLLTDIVHVLFGKSLDVFLPNIFLWGLLLMENCIDRSTNYIFFFCLCGRGNSVRVEQNGFLNVVRPICSSAWTTCVIERKREKTR